MANVSQAVARWLAEKEITHAMGLVGGGNVALWSAVAALQRTRIICCHHEQAAVMAAAFFNRTAGRCAAVALVTTGAGSTNAITGAMSAYMDSAPVLILSGNEASGHLGWGTRVLGVQGYPSAEMAEHCCKFTARVTAATWRSVLEAAYAEATEPRMGPTWVDICKSTQTESC